jgi:hypothetical protein
MRERNFILRNDRPTQYFAGDRWSNQLVLKPGILIKPVTIDLVQLKIIKIRPLIVVAKDRATSPARIATAVFILKAIP